MTSEESVVSAVERIVDHFGRVDFFVHCAGNNIKAPVLELSAADWSRVLDTHLTGAFLFSKAVGKYMVEQGDGGRVVFMSSVAATSPVPERGAYSPAKAGLVGLAGVLSLEWADYHINVNAVCPGGIITPMHGSFRIPEGAEIDLLKRAMPHISHVGPEHVANVIAFLASDDAHYINGEEIRIDGGALS